MKTIKLLSTVLAVAIVAIATAVEKPKMNVVSLADDSVVLIQKDNAARFKVATQAENSGLVYNEQTAKLLCSWKNDDVRNATDLRFVEVQETNLEIENWMTNSLVWDVQLETLRLENWMIDEDIWEVKNTLIIETETDQELSIENWMTNEEFWEM